MIILDAGIEVILVAIDLCNLRVDVDNGNRSRRAATCTESSLQYFPSP